MKDTLKGYIAGLLAGLALLAAVSAVAANINVDMGGIRVFWDGIETDLPNARGERVEPFIYNGTTYVPLRAMAGLMGLPVAWNQQELAVYLDGERPSGTIIPASQMVNYDGNEDCNYVIKTYEYNLKDKTHTCDEAIVGNDYYYSRKRYSFSYMLNGHYSRLTATAVMPYKSVGSNAEGKIEFYSCGDGEDWELIDRYDLQQSKGEVDIDVDLRGVENLWFKFSCGSNDIVMYDTAFTVR